MIEQPSRPSQEPAEPVYERVFGCIREAIGPAFKSTKWLLSIMIPVSLAVTLLHWSGILAMAAGLFAPFFSLVGLPGSSALVFLSSVSLNLYSAIAVIGTLEFTVRETTILALMCLISHNMVVETAVQRRTGSSPVGMVLNRLLASIAGALVLNAILPGSSDVSYPAALPEGMRFGPILPVLSGWAASTAFLVAKIALTITALMIFQRLLKEFGLVRPLSRLFAPLLRALGLPDETSFLWIVANTLGLAYGSTVLIEEVESGRLSRPHADLLNHHIGITHSLLEDTLLFAAIGVPAVWITIPRIALAGCSVWIRRLTGKSLTAAAPER